MRNDAVAVDKKRSRLYSVSTFVGKLLHRPNTGHLCYYSTTLPTFDGSIAEADRSFWALSRLPKRTVPRPTPRRADHSPSGRCDTALRAAKGDKNGAAENQQEVSRKRLVLPPKRDPNSPVRYTMKS